MRLKGLGLPLNDHGTHIVPVHVGEPVNFLSGDTFVGAFRLRISVRY